MKKKVISIVLVILFLICGGMVIYGATRRPAGNTSGTDSSSEESAERAGQQMAVSDAYDQEISEGAATPEATKQPEATEAPTATPKATKQPEITAAPTATPKETAEPKTTAAPTATPKTTKQPEKTVAPTATPAATKQPAVTPAPTVTNPPAQAHTCTWDGGSVTQAATCSSEGVKTYTCTSCGKTKTESLAKTDHSYVTETTPATCTEYGQDRTYCSVCGYEKSKVANSDAPKGHQPTDYRVSFGSYESTCTYGGDYDIYCGVCGACLQSDVPMAALGHQWDYNNPVVVKEAASCLFNSEIIQLTCTRCGETREESRYKEVAHQWEDAVRYEFDYVEHEEIEIHYQWCPVCGASK